MTNTGQVDQQTREEHSPQQAAAVACVLEDSDPQMDDGGIISHEERLDLYNTKQKETYKEVVIKYELNDKQRKEARQLVEEFKDIFSDVPTRNSSGDEIANVNFLYDDIVHAVKIQYILA